MLFAANSRGALLLIHVSYDVTYFIMRHSSGVVSELCSFSTLTISSSGAGRSVQLFGHFGDLLEISWRELWTDSYVNSLNFDLQVEMLVQRRNIPCLQMLQCLYQSLLCHSNITRYWKFRNFCEGFIFVKLRQCEVSRK